VRFGGAYHLVGRNSCGQMRSGHGPRRAVYRDCP
jgi:hypothetical protein